MTKIALLITLILVSTNAISAVNHEANQRDEIENHNAQKAITHLLKSTFDKPDSPLTVKPIVVEGDFAVAGWLQGAAGGRAFLQKHNDQWQVKVCSGDSLLQATTLTSLGMDISRANLLAERTKFAEANLAEELRKQLSSFKGTVVVNGHHGHGKHTPHKHGHH